MRQRGSKLWRIVLLAMIGGGGLALLAGQSGSALATERTPLKVVAPGGQKMIASEGLVAPTGLAIGPDGDFYVSNHGVFSGQGQVVRIAH